MSPSKFFILRKHTSKEAHVESHTNINHIYARSNETLSANATSAVLLSRLRVRFAFDEKKPYVMRSVHKSKFPYYQIKSYCPSRHLKNDDSLISIRFDAFLFHGRDIESDLLIFGKTTSCLRL